MFQKKETEIQDDCVKVRGVNDDKARSKIWKRCNLEVPMIGDGILEVLMECDGIFAPHPCTPVVHDLMLIFIIEVNQAMLGHTIWDGQVSLTLRVL